jgi:hypothetical protein
MRRGLGIAAGLLVLMLPATASAATRYAAPGGGTASGCPQLAPCSLREAITGASSGDEVVVSPGAYAVEEAIKTENPLFIHGQTIGARPRIAGASGVTPFQSFAPQHLSDLTVEANGGSEALFVPANGTVLERLELLAHGEGGLALRPGTNFTLTDSLIVADESPNAGGIFIQGTASGAPVLRNDTIVASGPESFGVALTVVQNDVSVNVQAVDVIASAATDATANVLPEKTGSTAAMAFDHSNLDNTVGAVTSTNGQTAPPQFVASYPPTFEQAPGSPTIDAGVNDPADGPLDLGGNPRSLPGTRSCGGTPPAVTDIGAYEFVPGTPTCVLLNPLVPPETTITRFKLRKRRVAFRFAAAGGTGAASFECRLDRKPFRPCTSPKAYKRLKPGKHVFQVRAIAAGLTDPSAAKRKFRIGRGFQRRHHHPLAAG